VEITMGNPVMHFELWSKTPEKVGAFYRDVFGWSIQPSGPLDYHQVQTGSDLGICGGIMTPPQPEPWPGNMSFYIAVDDLAAARKKVQQAGGKILLEEQEVPNMGSFALFNDPDGRVVGIWKNANAELAAQKAK
jgi:predicted enzyme related to lactoylglutathione lyase